ncbi:DUF3089 domain-containing protein [Streptomyces sp. NPDC088182]|uniref:DUF3089 domain-containing protein n=1 Tax=Streptomyces sp. NPDC088182 TaxID=3365838 RepID=UPI00380D0C11
MDAVRRLLIPVAAVLALVLLPTSAGASPAPVSAAAVQGTRPLDRTVWLCRPGLVHNPCGQDAEGMPQSAGPELVTHYPSGGTRLLDATRFTAGASGRREPFTVTEKPPVDCFYAYPTVDLLPNPPLQTGGRPPVPRDVHHAVTLMQSARFAGLCRMFVPVYRQVPLPALLAGIVVGSGADLTTATMDIRDAWDDYWTHDNRDPETGERRGVVILGHSQGTAVAAALMRERVDEHPGVRRQLVVAALLGGNIEVPEGRDAGGGADPASTFQHIPACRRPGGAPMPTGCVVSYATYSLPRGSLPAVIGRTASPGHRVVCVNPAALLRGEAAGARVPLDLYLPTRRLIGGSALLPNGPLAVPLNGYQLPDLPTGFARHPDALTGECTHATDGTASADWLQVGGDLSHFPASAPAGLTGLHAMDFNVAQGDLVALAAAQTRAWLDRRRP